MRNCAVLLAFVVLSLESLAQQSSVEAELARKLEGTVYTVPRRSSADGILQACGLEFSEIKRDFSTRRGAPVTIVGSFYLRLTKLPSLVYNMKIGLFDGLGNTTTPVAPANAFISAPQGKAPKKAIRADSDTPGYTLYVGPFDDDVLAAYVGIVEKKKLVLGFNRASGQQDVTATIDLTVVDANFVNDKVVRTRSDDAVLDFVSCVGDLLKQTNKALGK